MPTLRLRILTALTPILLLPLAVPGLLLLPERTLAQPAPSQTQDDEALRLLQQGIQQLNTG